MDLQFFIQCSVTRVHNTLSQRVHMTRSMVYKMRMEIPVGNVIRWVRMSHDAITITSLPRWQPKMFRTGTGLDVFDNWNAHRRGEDD